MGSRINTVMQPCFFKLAGILPAEEAIEQIKAFVKKTYAKRGEAVVARNYAAIDHSLERLGQVTLGGVDNQQPTTPPVQEDVPDFVARVTSRLMAGDGDLLPVSALPADGTFPSGTTKYEKRDRAADPHLGSLHLHRLRQVRHGLPARHDPHEGLPDGGRRRGRPPTSSTRSSSRATCRTTASPSRSLRTIAPAAACAWTSAPPRARPTTSHKAINMEPVLEHRDIERPLGLLPVHRAARPQPDRARHGQGQPGPRAALRVLRRLWAVAARRPTSGWSASSSATA